MSWIAGKSRLILAVAGLLLAAGYVRSAMQLRMPAFSDPVGPRLVPYMIAIGLVLSCIALAIEHFVNARARTDGTDETESGLTGVALVALGLLAGYYLVFEWLGFILATAVFLFAFLSFTNRRGWMVNASVAIAFPLAAYLLLATLLGARLPAGVLSVG